MNELVFGRDAEVGDWVRLHMRGVSSWGDAYHAIGLRRAGVLIAGCVFNHYSVRDIWASIAADGRGQMTRGFIRACFRYPFIQLKTRRVTVAVGARNHRSEAFIRALGFKYEGRAREAFEDDDALIFGMLRSECRWLGE